MKRRARQQQLPEPKAAKQRPEQVLHLAVMRHVEARLARGAIVWHTPNAAKRGLVEGSVFRRLGTRPGIPDLLALRSGGPLCGLELKSARGRLSPAQKETIAALKAAGARVEVANTFDDALDHLERWGILRGQRQ
jgi:VRR-NUC domain